MRFSVFAAGLLSILLAASVWMFANATAGSLIFDEVSTARSIRLPFLEMLEERAQRGHAPVYFSTMWLWTRVAGDGELALRTPATVFALLSAVVLAMLVSMLADRRSSLLAALLLVLHPSIFYFGRLARPYSLVLLLLLSATLLTALTSRSSHSGRALALAVITALAVHTHSSAFLAVGGLMIWCCWRRTAARSALIALTAGTASYLPWLLFARPWDNLDRNLGWTFESDRTPVLRIVDVWHQFPGEAPPWQLILPLCALALGVWGFRKARDTQLRWLLVCAGCVPLLLAVIALVLGVANLFTSERYLLISVAGWTGFSAIAIGAADGESTCGRSLRSVALIVLVISMMAGSARLVMAPPVTWREVVAEVDRHIEDGSYAVLLLPAMSWEGHQTLEYYLRHSKCPGRVTVGFADNAGGHDRDHGRGLLLSDPLTELAVPRWANHLVVFLDIDSTVEATSVPWVDGLEDRGFRGVETLQAPRGTLISLSRTAPDARPPPPAAAGGRGPTVRWQRLHGVPASG